MSGKLWRMDTPEILTVQIDAGTFFVVLDAAGRILSCDGPETLSSDDLAELESFISMERGREAARHREHEAKRRRASFKIV